MSVKQVSSAVEDTVNRGKAHASDAADHVNHGGDGKNVLNGTDVVLEFLLCVHARRVLATSADGRYFNARALLGHAEE